MVSIILVPVFGLGLLTGLAVFAATLIFCIPAAMKTNKGENYRYPLNWRIVK